MKTAIYIEDGVVQLVITPQNDFEKNALRSFSENKEDSAKVEATIFRGTFYDCRGGWVRQTTYRPMAWDGGESEDRSLIIRSVTNSER